MDEFGRGQQFRHILYLLLEPVFDRFHVMVGDCLDRLDALGVGVGEVGGKPLQQRCCAAGKRFDLCQAGSGKRLQPGDFDLDPVMHEAGFRQQRAQPVGAGGVATVERRQGGEGSDRHGGRLAKDEGGGSDCLAPCGAVKTGHGAGLRHSILPLATRAEIATASGRWPCRIAKNLQWRCYT